MTRLRSLGRFPEQDVLAYLEYIELDPVILIFRKCTIREKLRLLQLLRGQILYGLSMSWRSDEVRVFHFDMLWVRFLL